MRSLSLMLLCAVTLGAQAGVYHFVQISVRGSGAAIEVRNAGGTLTVDGTRTQFTGYVGTDAAAGEPLNAIGIIGAGRLSSALVVGQSLALRTNRDASVLVASSAGPSAGGESFDLLIAVRHGTGTPALNGNYSGTYFSLSGGKAFGLTSAFLNFTAAGNAWANASLIGHTAARDDVNREEQPAGITYSLGAGGAGVVRFPPGSDYLSGDRELMVSADGAWLLGYSRADRDIFIGLRRDADRMLDGLYWMAELGAEEPFAFDAGRVRWSAGAGTLRADGSARAEIAQQVIRQRDASTANTWLTTANAYYADSSGRAALVPALTSDRRRNNFDFTLDGLIGAQVGTPGEVTLEHGIFAGARAAAPADTGVALTPLGVFNGASFALGPVSPLGYVTLFGTNLAPATAVAASYPFPTELAGTRVLVNGQPAPLHSVSPGQINFQWSATQPGAATVQVSAAAGLSDTLPVSVAGSSPGVFRGAVVHADNAPVTSSNPARPGETLVVYATGLGAVNPAVVPGEAAPATPLSRTTDASLRVYIAGAPAIVEFSGLAPGFAGLYQLNVRVPEDSAAATAAPIAISLADAFTDLAEIAIVR